MKLTVNGIEVEAQEGRTVLEVARAAGFEIPTLCYHPAVSPGGVCRVCLVEVKAGRRTRLVTSCCYPAAEGIEVFTDSERALRARRGVVELLLARVPDSPELQALAASLGVRESRFPTVTRAESRCILCGLCVAVCREVIGSAAISAVSRGMDRAIAPPYSVSSEDCVGCGACAAVCPVGAVEVRWEGDELEIAPFKNRGLAMRCGECGAPISGKRYAESVSAKLGEKAPKSFGLCLRCRRKVAARCAWNGRGARSAWSQQPEGVDKSE